MNENEEFEFRLRLEKEQEQARAAAQAGAAPEFQPEPMNWLEQTGRALALTPRYVAHAVTGLPAMLADAPVNVLRAAGVRTPPTSSESVDNLLTRMGVPQPETTPEKISDFGISALYPTNLGAKAGAMTLGQLGKSSAQNLMYSALKPTLAAHQSGDAELAVKTLLDRGINVSKGGVEKLQDMITGINKKIEDTILNSNATVDKQYVVNAIDDVWRKFSKQVTPQDDLATISAKLNQFLNNPAISTSLPVQTAQELKQGTYQILRNKYGEQGSAATEAQKAMARGLKEGIAAAEPSVDLLNKEESALIRTLGVTERRVMMDLNRNPTGLASLATNPKAAAAFVADRSPLFKSLFARMLNRASETAGATLGATGGISLYGLGQAYGQPQNPPAQLQMGATRGPALTLRDVSRFGGSAALPLALTPSLGLRVPETE